jgi:septum formation protein
MPSVILASGSPRRSDILATAGFTFTVIKPDVDEVYPSTMPVREVPAYLAGIKMDAAMQMVNQDAIVITADTVVILDEQIIGKPKDAEDAFSILRRLSGNMHLVVSGVCLQYKDVRYDIDVTTKVYFDVLTDTEIRNYLETCKPYDKAGAYAIQEWIGMNKISRIEGDYYNVVGFPMSKIYPVLTALLNM